MAGIQTLFRPDIAADTGEKANLFPLHFTSFAGVVLATACVTHDLPNGVLADAIVLLTLQILFLRQQYLKNAPAEWNPARHLVSWGLGLANAGVDSLRRGGVGRHLLTLPFRDR